MYDQGFDFIIETANDNIIDLSITFDEMWLSNLI